MSPAATIHPTGTPVRTPTPPRTRSSARSSRAKTGAGATWTRWDSSWTGSGARLASRPRRFWSKQSHPGARGGGAGKRPRIVADAGIGAGGLTEAEARRRLEAQGRPSRQRSSRSYASIVRANTLTIPNGILFAFGLLTIAFGSWKDAL